MSNRREYFITPCSSLLATLTLILTSCASNVEIGVSSSSSASSLVPIFDLAMVSLCVVLAGGQSDGGVPMERCQRSGGTIVSKGDWCAATNQPANGSCADAVLFSGTLAASGVKIN